MTSEPHTPADPVPQAPADVLAEVTAVVVGMLRLESGTVDTEQTFQALGIDSLLTVEFISSVNQRFGTRITAGALYDHPTPTALARHVAAELGMPGLESEAEPATGGASVVDVLRERLAGLLCCGPWDIDADVPFRLMGIDSILGAEFVSEVNRAYGLREKAGVLHDHPTLADLAAHVASRAVLAATAAPAVRVPRDTTDLDALLDAVRDDRISIDEAAALLAARAA
ncbi:acyl carrier protein [Streptomyces sp. NPDC001480]|uniref:acyl carrier protein n=1 Tax=Streptomyces sp. NPDC001480 TaxID=3364577 RepID=UPI0036B9CBA4